MRIRKYSFLDIQKKFCVCFFLIRNYFGIMCASTHNAHNVHVSQYREDRIYFNK